MSGVGHPHESLSALVDGALDPIERAEVERHLESCADCRIVLEDLRAMRRAVAEAETPPVPAGLHRRIDAALDAERPFRRRWRFAYSAAAATVAAAALLAVYEWRQGGFAPSPPSSVEDKAERSVEAPPPPRPDAPQAPAPGLTREPAAESTRKEKLERPRAEDRRTKKDAVGEAAPRPEPSRDENRVPGGVVGGVEGAVAPAEAPPAPPPPLPQQSEEHLAREKNRVAAPTAGSSMTTVVRNTPGAIAPCPSPVMLTPAMRWPVAPSSRVSSLATLRATATRHGAHANVSAEGGRVTLDVPAREWSALARDLESDGVPHATTIGPVPPGAECVRVEILLVEP